LSGLAIFCVAHLSFSVSFIVSFSLSPPSLFFFSFFSSLSFFF
ncbi:hypothetical protein CSUI_003021, partial [Cystoisospora suis]